LFPVQKEEILRFKFYSIFPERSNFDLPRFLCWDLAGGEYKNNAGHKLNVSWLLQMNGNLTIGKAMRWWEKGMQPNMREVESAQDLADSLRNAGDRLVVVDFFSPGCGGCRALHPKVQNS
jgi:thiol-disulfide isomerase/thioredoxin